MATILVDYENVSTTDGLKGVEDCDVKVPKLLYTGSLHEFGREDGRVIYQMLKKVV